MKKQKFFNIEHKSLDEIGVKNYQELWAKAQADGFEGIAICLSLSLTKADSANSFHATFSTANEDRHGDIVMQNWDLKSFKKNPVFLDSHNYDSIEHILGKVTSIKQEKVLEGDIEFFVDNPKGLLAKQAAEGGFLSATSVGFIPKMFNDKGNIIESELLEISAVSVPANAEALFEKKEEAEKKKIIRKTSDHGVICIYCNADITETEKQFELPDGDIGGIPIVELVCENCYNEKKDKPAEVVALSARPSATKTLNNAVRGLLETEKKQLTALSKAVHELTEENRMSKKKQIHQIIRGLINKG